MFYEAFQTYLNSLWYIVYTMAPYLIFGFVIAGILHVLLPQQMIVKYAGKPTVKSVVNAALLGVPLPLCSCGVIPTGVSLYNSGASKGATTSFLISTPQTGVDSIFATYALLGLPFAIIRPIAAFITGIAGGILTNLFYPDNKIIPVEKSIDTNPKLKKNKWIELVHYAFITLLGDIVKWLIIGLMLAALIDVLVPANFFTEYVQSDLLSIFLVLIIAVPLYVCATASIPIAAILMLKGLSPGAAFVFLMAGPATNIATITVLSKVLGKKSLGIYLSTIIVGSMAIGLLINLFPREWFTVASIHATHNHDELLPAWIMYSSTFLLLALIVYHLIQKYIPQTKSSMATPNTYVISVQGMNCSHCKANVENALQQVEGITNIDADVQKQQVTLTAIELDVTMLKEKIEKAGYTFGGIQ